MSIVQTNANSHSVDDQLWYFINLCVCVCVRTHEKVCVLISSLPCELAKDKCI